MMFYGFEIIQDVNLVDEVFVPRTWKERLFTLPWNPFKKFKTQYIPKEDCYQIGDKIICHPQTFNKILIKLCAEEYLCTPTSMLSVGFGQFSDIRNLTSIDIEVSD